MPGLQAAESTLDAIARIAHSGTGAQALLEEAAERIDRVVPTDGYFLSATDPETTLSIGMGVVNDLPPHQCQPTWEYEFLVPDFVKFADISRSGRAVADIHDATGGRPERSPRFREYSAATGYRAEVRLAFSIGDAAWGIGQLNRAGPARASATRRRTGWSASPRISLAGCAARSARRQSTRRPAAGRASSCSTPTGM